MKITPPARPSSWLRRQQAFSRSPVGQDALTRATQGAAAARAQAEDAARMSGARHPTITTRRAVADTVIARIADNGVVAVTTPGVPRAGDSLARRGTGACLFRDGRIIAIIDRS